MQFYKKNLLDRHFVDFAVNLICWIFQGFTIALSTLLVNYMMMSKSI